MKRRLILFVFIAGVAAAFRFFALDIRPMHTDEAVHALKFGRLLGEGYYRYDQNEYHGPTLNYLTLIPAMLFRKKNIRDLNEIILRVVPAFFGTAILLLLLMARNRISDRTLIFAALFLAVSPAMIFYSRYYIQEMLLVFFTYAALFSLLRYSGKGNWWWGILAGFFLGLMFATKETWIIALPGMMIALVVFRPVNFSGGRFFKKVSWIILPAVLVSAVFYSSFFSHPQGLIDSLTAYGTYFERAGLNETGRHIHPWYYYLQLLIFTGNGAIRTEIFILAAGVAGLIAALKHRKEQEGNFFLAIAAFSGLTGFVYSMLPYKTPWNLLTFYTGWIMLAGYGMSAVFRKVHNRKVRYALGLVAVAGTLHLVYQAYMLNFRHYADPENPWVYAHTSRDIFRIRETVDKISRAQPSGKDIYVEVIATGHDYWPLPWYLRNYPNIGWRDQVPMQGDPAPVILASPGFREEVLKKIYELPPPGHRYLYVPLFDSKPELRPGVYLEGYVRKDVWDRYMREKEEK